MIIINSLNGEIELGRFVVCPNMKSNDFIERFSSKELELWLSNNEWKSYKLNISETYVFILMFFQAIIKSVEIYPSVIDESKVERPLQELLENLGGENNYSWGKVEVNVDHKAGYKSIMIYYT